MRRQTTNYVALILLMLVTGVVFIYTTKFEYQAPSTDSPSVVKTVIVGETSVAVPSWNIFRVGHIWELVSSARHLDTNYVPSLVEAPVAHASGEVRVAGVIAPQLKAMVDAAANDGVRLMLSSAYRSAAGQREIYDAYLRLHGQQYVQSYVAQPGSSEHQTGLAVDISTVSSSCVATGDSCSLNASGIAWLRVNAARYGFIERYPEGKQSITGVAGEHWHYRYVGIPLAKALAATNLTFDEFVQQTAPGYAE